MRLRYAAPLCAFALVMLGVHALAHAVVAAGTLAWLACLGAIVWLAVILENRKRTAEGCAPYSLAEAGELTRPALALVGILAAAWCWSHWPA